MRCELCENHIDIMECYICGSPRCPVHSIYSFIDGQEDQTRACCWDDWRFEVDGDHCFKVGEQLEMRFK